MCCVFAHLGVTDSPVGICASEKLSQCPFHIFFSRSWYCGHIQSYSYFHIIATACIFGSQVPKEDNVSAKRESIFLPIFSRKREENLCHDNTAVSQWKSHFGIVRQHEGRGTVASDPCVLLLNCVNLWVTDDSRSLHLSKKKCSNVLPSFSPKRQNLCNDHVAVSQWSHFGIVRQRERGGSLASDPGKNSSLPPTLQASSKPMLPRKPWRRGAPQLVRWR